MQYLITCLLVLGFPWFGYTQTTVPHFEKTAVGKSGAYAYMPAKAGEATEEYSPDSSKVYTLNCSLDKYNFDVIFVKLREPVSGNADIETLLVAYLDYLKEALQVTKATGYGKGHTLDTHTTATGIIDYWSDAENNEMSVTGWADGNYIAVLLITGSAQYPNTSVSQVFFKGIRFPGDK
jgi:hypothetical protein